MFRCAGVSALILVTLLPVSATAETIFFGRLRYLEATNCSRQSAGSQYRSTYIPSHLSDNGERTIISESYDIGGHSYILERGRFTTAFQTVTDLSHGQGVGIGSSRIRITSSDPKDADLKTTTDFVSLTGEIETPQGDPGVDGKKCVMSFAAVYVRKY